MIPSTVRAALFEAAGRALEIQQLPMPALQAGQVLVRVRMCTLCGSDLHTFSGRRTTPAPCILGHEILGQIEEIHNGGSLLDAAGREVRPGDRITWAIAVHCGGCFYCREGWPQKCESLHKFGHTAVSSQWPLSGGLAEYCFLPPGTSILGIPDELPDAVACPVNCATATIAAAMRRGSLRAGQSVLIHGAGMLGLTACAWARMAGATAVLIVDPNRERARQARSFGATHTFDGSGLSELRTACTKVSNGRGVDLALEISGSGEAIQEQHDLLRIGGHQILIGSVFPQEPVPCAAETIVRKCLTIQGIHNYAPEDLVKALQFLQSAHVNYPFESLVRTGCALSDVNKALEIARTGSDLRVAVQP